ncbi:cytochrome P450 [Aspergillus pseudoustus]|uniref:Cytochrome P450 n=1 Tax=Aspergillus pseudoustus TaxID=1810923 RepID=A0ABR4J0W1_9EURO
MGLSYVASVDDEYMGYTIPKGSTIMINDWAINHDAKTFENPETFNPERWLDGPSASASNVDLSMRACPGQHVAEQSVFLNVARLLWAFDATRVRRAVDDPNPPGPSLASPFKASFNVRSEEHKAAIDRYYDDLSSGGGDILDFIEQYGW